MNPSIALLLFSVVVVCNSASAAEERKTETGKYSIIPTGAVDLSYPLLLSVSVGVLLPLSQSSQYLSPPTVPSLRLDGQFGVGGGSAAVGLYVPIGTSYALNLKAVHMRTWLWTWPQKPDMTFRNFDGGVVEFMLHRTISKVGLGRYTKFGLGYFRAPQSPHATFVYVSVGVGF